VEEREGKEGQAYCVSICSLSCASCRLAMLYCNFDEDTQECFAMLLTTLHISDITL